MLSWNMRPWRASSTRSTFRRFTSIFFQDVYEWAGDFRTVSISKSGDPFAFPQHIVSSLDKTCAELKSEGHLAGSDLARFASRGAYYLGEVNAIHPFREGNGRTQREFIRELALQSRLIIDWRQISQEEMIEASRRRLRIDNFGLEQVLRKALHNEPVT
jgi:cell filamentation protein